MSRTTTVNGAQPIFIKVNVFQESVGAPTLLGCQQNRPRACSVGACSEEVCWKNLKYKKTEYYDGGWCVCVGGGGGGGRGGGGGGGGGQGL